MLSQRLLELFDDHHRRATTLITAQRALLTPGASPDPAALARYRWELLRVLVEFEMFKHRDIFDPAIRQGDPRVAAQARMMKQDCAALGAEVRAFTTRWSSGTVTDEWEHFRTEKLALFYRIERGLVGQRRGIAQMSAPARPVMAGGRDTIDRPRPPAPFVNTYAGRR